MAWRRTRLEAIDQQLLRKMMHLTGTPEAITKWQSFAANYLLLANAPTSTFTRCCSIQQSPFQERWMKALKLVFRGGEWRELIIEHDEALGSL
jgi:hypothetical protein